MRDVFAVNKADRDGADATVRDLELMIALGKETLVASGKIKGHTVHGRVSAHTREGAGRRVVDAADPARDRDARGGDRPLVAALDEHAKWLRETETGRTRRQERLAEELRESLREALIDAATHALGASIDEAVRAVDAREVDPYTATETLIQAFKRA